MNDLVRKTMFIVLSSKRIMPAHFTSLGDRTKTFLIDFESLTADEELSMASESWGSASSYLKSINLSKNQFYVVLRCGEDLMLGTFILIKKKGRNFLEEFKKSIIEDSLESFKNIEKLNEVFSSDKVNEYFSRCLRYGAETAESVIL